MVRLTKWDNGGKEESSGMRESNVSEEMLGASARMRRVGDPWGNSVHESSERRMDSEFNTGAGTEEGRFLETATYVDDRMWRCRLRIRANAIRRHRVTCLITSRRS